MAIILYPKYPGSILICEGCGAIVKYDAPDIYANRVYCPQCRTANNIERYEAEIKKEEEKKNDKSTSN